MRRRIALTIGAALAAFGLAACGGDQGNDGAASPSTSPSTEQGTGAPSEQGTAAQGDQGQMPQPNLDGIPQTVAEVNGEQITKEDFVASYQARFQQAAMQAQQSGQPVDQQQLKQQTVESMVGTELLTQEADNRGYEVTQQQLDQALNEVVQASGLGSPDELMKAMEEQGMGEDEVMSQLETQVEVDRLVGEEAGDTAPSEQEMRQLYDQMAAQQQSSGQGQGQQMPSFEEAKPQLEQQIQSQKESEAARALVTELRESGDVTVNL
ncbi:SurA N-terminal domain-containing protein [Georgenia halophila]|uniref:SurA N-terminal domain-containing protein n=1 Tax=Georgenia halophila TaxID=620889 RepID=A0ABP8L4Q4_9MICO